MFLLQTFKKKNLPDYLKIINSLILLEPGKSMTMAI